MTAQAEIIEGRFTFSQITASRRRHTVAESVDPLTWDEFVTDAPSGHIMQGWAWGEYKRRSGWKPVRLAMMRDGDIVAGAQILIRRVLGVGFAYVPRGPVCDPKDDETYRQMLQAVHNCVRRRQCFFLRVEPNEWAGSTVERLLREQGFRQAPQDMRPLQPLASFMVDLTGGTDAVQSRMKRRAREYVRSAGRRLQVRPVSNETDIAIFHDMMMELASRKQVAARPVSYYQTLLEELGPRQQASLLLAEQDGTTIGGIIALAYGQEGTFWHSASPAVYHKTHVNQLLQWKAMEWCIQRGCTRYEFGGVFDPRTVNAEGQTVYLPVEPEAMEPEERGLFLYKQQFGGTPIRYIGAYDYPYMNSLYRVWRRLARVQGRCTDLMHGIGNRSHIVRRQIRQYVTRPGKHIS